MEVQAVKSCNGDFIRYTHQDLTTIPIDDQTIQVRIEYGDGYSEIGMADAYTMRMLTVEFRTLTPSWDLCPCVCYSRGLSGAVIHETRTVEDGVYNVDGQILCLPRRIQKDGGRCTEISLREDQLSILDHWAYANQTDKVGVSIQVSANSVMEYWLLIQLDHLAGEPLEEYLT
jgi:hypothetical protein